MNKLTLDFDALQVESFATAPVEKERGTVVGREVFGPRTRLESCQGSCVSFTNTCPCI